MAKITTNPKILGGKPIIKGTRISVEFIMELLASGMAIDEIIKEYPQLTKKDIYSVLKYATELVAGEEMINISRIVHA